MTARLTVAETSHLARITGFWLAGSGRSFRVVRPDRMDAWIGTLAECYAWLAGRMYSTDLTGWHALKAEKDLQS